MRIGTGSVVAATAGFNGAALNRARKSNKQDEGYVLSWLASMGPRSIERGNRAVRSRAWQAHLRCASMGPRSIERGNFSAHEDLCNRQPGFNGAALNRARKFYARGRHEHDMSLQWGRAQSSAEMEFCLVCSTGCSDSFNGAALNRARKSSWLATRLHHSTSASMGPRSIERGNSLLGTVPLAVAGRSFNGAALNRARKS